jgi:hypothetical protein
MKTMEKYKSKPIPEQLSYSHWCNLVNGNRPITWRVAKILSTLLNIGPAELMDLPITEQREILERYLAE